MKQTPARPVAGLLADSGAEAEGAAKAAGPRRFRRLRWDELVRIGDYVGEKADGREAWDGPGGFRAGSFEKPIYRLEQAALKAPKEVVGMKFTDPQLQECYDNNLVEARELPSELRPVGALIGVLEVFQMFEGPHSARVHEIMERLLLPALRPALRRWYARAGVELGPSAILLRNELSRLAGEKLERSSEAPGRAVAAEEESGTGTGS